MMDAVPIAGAEIYLRSDFLPRAEADALFETLLSRAQWQRHKGMFGHDVPREEAYYGDAGTEYTYSLRQYRPLPWMPELLALKMRVEEATENLGMRDVSYNAVLCNLYRDGRDSVGLHADAEPEMGPVIASVSLGAERLFRMRRKDGEVVFSRRLPHGSLLVMGGKTQKNLRHEVPKEAVAGARINLTFRRIEQSSG